MTQVAQVSLSSSESTRIGSTSDFPRVTATVAYWDQVVQGSLYLIKILALHL
jgi:hypothetical protein